MAENVVVVSADRMELTITNDNGHKATVRSARPDGFTDEHIEMARTTGLSSTMVEGQVNRARLYQAGTRAFLVQVNTGPPTWWYPRIQISRTKIMAGWFRALIAVSVG